ncbi:unnamed protein product [Camellia sinensis]
MSSVEEIANPGNSSTPVEHKLDASMSSSKTNDWLGASPLSLEVEENIADIDELEQALNVVSLNVISD